MTAPAPPGDRPALRTLAAVALPCAVVPGLAVGGAVAAAPPSVRVPLALGGSAGAILLCAALTVAVHALRTARTARRALEAARAEAERLDAELARLAGEMGAGQERLRAEAAREREDLLAEHGRATERAAEEAERERTRLAERWDREVARLTEETARLRARLDLAASERAAALSATANAAGRMQALATGMLADLRAMEERHSDEDVLADLLHLDHRTAQAGRIADSVAVLTGARSGRRWARPIAMESILRGAMGRIAGYRRVRVHSVSDSAVAGHAAEGVMHALAEILDNAATFSPPSAEVHVYVEEVPSGVIVSVEDSGLVMGDVQLRRAERAVSGDSAGLGGLTGTRLGLAVVGRLSVKYGLRVSFRPSARGGTGVLVLIPQDILAGATGTGSATGSGTPSTTGSASGSTPVSTAGSRSTPVSTAGSQTTPVPTAGSTSTAGSTAGSLTAPAPAGPSAETAETPGATARDQGTEPARTGRADGTDRTGATAEPVAPPAAPPATAVPAARKSPEAPARPQAAPHHEDPRPGKGARPHPDDQPRRTSAPGTDRTTNTADTADTTNTADTAAPSAATAPASTAADGTEPPGLPRRRRGRTLAAAERTRAARAAAPPAAPPAEGDAKARVARFSSFRQAVRSAGHGSAARDTSPGAERVTAPPDGTHPDDPSPTHAHPEGDTTS
ncbi:sensor histidine kinase [Streptomyces tagetis]|uniref:histidine kinase n=1 Tax=Streptomyces tagetis TaxID=2820809 RepID=A0A940XH16_9ACTN|nr:ATP-binding protein [Streptomyces sp. RG38]MBQ0827027.1 ATP-binding protein [Streptomyces sp. RG38]